MITNDRPPASPCPHPDLLAAFAEGKLQRHELPPVLAHIDECVRCLAAVEAVNEDRSGAEAAAPSWRAWWMPAAAAIVLALLAIPALRLTRGPSVARLVALAPDDARAVEPRLTGGFRWAPYRGPLRAADGAADPERLQLAGVAGELAARARRDPSAAAQHAAGVAMIAIEKPEEAMARLEAATAAAPDDATAWSDLAAARYATATLRSRASLFPEALAAADRALRIDPRLPEARFNRALILERIGLAQQARAAWERYLEVDTTSAWAAEVRKRLSAIPATNDDAEFRRQLPLLEQSAAGSDTATVAKIVARYPQQSRSFAEGDHLGRWGEAVRRGDEVEAARLLAIATRIGDALLPVAGESLLRDACAAIAGADAPHRVRLADAHATYRRARIAFSQQKPAAAEPGFRLAAARFAEGGSPMALVARYYAASAAYEENDAPRAAAELETLLRERLSPALSAQVRWELALCRILDDDWEGALALLSSAAAELARLGERRNLAFVEGLRATALVPLGRPDESWAARIRAFEALSAAGAGDRLALSIGAAARMAMRAGQLDAAAPLLSLEQEAVRGNDVQLANVLVRKASLDAARGENGSAMDHARDAAIVARRIADGALRARAENDARFASAAAVLPQDARHARALLDAAIAGYETRQMPAFLAESYLLRARAALRLGEKEAAARDLERGIAAVERHPIRIAESVAGLDVLDAGVALFEEAIALALDRGDAATAFAYAERSHGVAANAASASGVAARLHDTGAMVLELVALPKEVVAFSLTRDGLAVARHRLARPDLAALVERMDEAALYDALIRPSGRTLATARQLVVVADPMLATVPFAALYDRRTAQPLVRRVAVAMAANATALRAVPAAAPRSLLAMTLPSGDRPGLPESDRELADVATLYRHTTVLPSRTTLHEFLASARSADALHIAGHTERQPGRGDVALVFARGGTAEHVSWKTISTSRLGKPAIVVLSACETLRTPAGTGQRALSLGAGFLAAGASSVIGTLTPIADSDARALFRTIHRELAAGAAPAEAVRRAQLAFLEEDLPQRRRGGWQSVALLTNRIAIERRK